MLANFQVLYLSINKYTAKVHLYLHLFEDDALSVGSTGERLLILTTQITLLVILVCPALFTAMKPELTPGSHTTGLTYRITKMEKS
jgi:hypothetical protein